MKQKYQAYAAATQTVAGTRQVVMLYDGIVRYLQQAREAMHEKRIEDRYNLLVKASEIVFGLQSCLDFERGGDIAKILYNFYSSVDGRIFSLHRTNSVEECDRIIKDIREMRDAWNLIDAGGENAPSSDADNGDPAGGAAPAQGGSLASPGASMNAVAEYAAYSAVPGALTFSA